MLKSLFHSLLLTCVAVTLITATGCRKDDDTPAPGDQPTSEKGSEDAKGKTDGGETPKEKGAEDDTAKKGKASPDTSGTAVDTKTVMLGDPSLTGGIPGDGDLTVEQIQAWVDDAGNHEVLKVELPLGLAAGAGMIKGVEENPLTRAKIELGRQLFFDGRLSSDGTISCASCHQPGHGYAAETQFGVGVDGQEGPVNTPVAYNRILSDKQFWDGRAASLEEQAVGPIANPIEMASTHEKAVETVKNIDGYRIQFEKVFPADGVTIDNIGKAIATFERVLVTAPSPFDYNEQVRAYADLSEDDLATLKEDDAEDYAQYERAKADAEATPMSDSAKRGHELFFSDKANCSACHVGPNLADELYHNLGIGMDAEEPNLGRYGQTKEEKDKGAFKTPTIRNVATSPPYMHDGSLKTLEEVVEHYVKGGTPNDWLSKDMHKLELSDQDKKDLIAFMEACTGELPPVETGRLPQ